MNDDLETFLEEVIYDNEKDRRRDRQAAASIAADKAPKYARAIMDLLGAGCYELINGGHADGAGFNLSLEDGTEIEGNEFGARFNKVQPKIPESARQMVNRLVEHCGSCPEDFDPEQLRMGIEVELEDGHTKSRKRAQEIAIDHLKEDPKYYTKLKKAGL